MASISDELQRSVQMVPRAWKLTQQEDKASQTMPLEWIKRGWMENGGEEKTEEKKKAKREEEKGETQVERINISDDTEDDYFSDIERELCEIYDRKNEEE